jgi:dTDP-4-amino-4,6-dideoxygalactose transaminase
MRKLFRYFYKVPWCVPAWGWAEFLATVRCLATNSVIKGPYPRTFADETRIQLGIKYALPVNKGRVAIEIALKSLGISKEDDVVLPAYICSSVLESVTRAGARPVYADIGPDLHVTSGTIKRALTGRTKCVIVPHLFGNTAPIDEIETMLAGTGIALIDDAAQSFGALCAGRMVGTFGAFGIVSCGPGKSLAGAAGGLLVTNDGILFERASSFITEDENVSLVVGRVVSFWVWRRFRKVTLPVRIMLDRLLSCDTVGEVTNCCAMSNLDGAIALAQLKSRDDNARHRRHHASMLLGKLGNISGCSISDVSDESMYLKLVIVIPPNGISRDTFIQNLALAGIEAQGGYEPLRHAAGILPVTDEIWSRVVCIPVESPFRGKLPLTCLSLAFYGQNSKGNM